MSLTFVPHSRPVDTLSSRGRIWFFHPGYPEPSNRLITLPRVDADKDPNVDQPRYGVYYKVALLACQVIAGNAFDGYLVDAQRRRIEPPTAGEREMILLESKYYFVIDGQGTSL